MREGALGALFFCPPHATPPERLSDNAAGQERFAKFPAENNATPKEIYMIS